MIGYALRNSRLSKATHSKLERRRKWQARKLLLLDAQLEDRVLLSGDCYANLFAGPRLASVDSAQSELLEGVFNALLPGSYINLEVTDWNAIASGDVQLNTFLGALQADLGLSSPSQVLSANVTLSQIFDATADAIPADGDTAALHAAVVPPTESLPVLAV